MEFLCCYDLEMSQQMCYFSEKLLLCELRSKRIIPISFTERPSHGKMWLQTSTKGGTDPTYGLRAVRITFRLIGLFVARESPSILKVMGAVGFFTGNRSLRVPNLGYTWEPGSKVCLDAPTMPQKWQEYR